MKMPAFASRHRPSRRAEAFTDTHSDVDQTAHSWTGQHRLSLLESLHHASLASAPLHARVSTRASSQALFVRSRSKVCDRTAPWHVPRPPLGPSRRPSPSHAVHDTRRRSTHRRSCACRCTVPSGSRSSSCRGGTAPPASSARRLLSGRAPWRSDARVCVADARANNRRSRGGAPTMVARAEVDEYTPKKGEVNPRRRGRFRERTQEWGRRSRWRRGRYRCLVGSGGSTPVHRWVGSVLGKRAERGVHPTHPNALPTWRTAGYNAGTTVLDLCIPMRKAFEDDDGGRGGRGGKDPDK